jgi:acetylornithine deacetylase/succinyl-diaminopimelate desuccinylase-like protein
MKKESINKIYDRIDQNIEKHIKRVQEFLRQPSVASQDYGMRECANLFLKYIEKLGFQDIELVETDRHPVACGRYDSGSDTTLIIHGMYDTAPIRDENKWISPPFDAKVKYIENIGDCIIAPGALRKSPNATFVNALEAILDVKGTLPVNIVFNVEGEHGLMSPNYPQFYEKYKNKIKNADAVYWPMLSQNLDGKISVLLGHKGMMGFQLICDAKKWGRGPLERPLHNADAGIVDNTTWRLMDALGTMTSRAGKDIIIDNYMDDVRKLSQKDLELMNNLVEKFDTNNLKEEWKIKTFADDLEGAELLKKHLFSPVFCIGNIHGGAPRPAPYPVSKVNVHIRLVPDQSVDGILQKVRNHLDSRGYEEIQILPQYGVPWIKTEFNDPLVSASVESYEEFNCLYEVVPNGTKTPPTGVYNLPYMDGGIGYGRRGINELMLKDSTDKVAGIADCEKYFVSFLYNYSKASSK